MDAGRKLPSISASARLTVALQWTYCALVALMLVPLGSVDPRPLHLFSLCFFLLSALSVATAPIPERLRSPFFATVILSCTLAVWIIIQSLDIPNNALANPIWAQAELIFGQMPRTISVAPSDSIETMIPTLLPFVVFATGLLLFPSDDSAQRLLTYLCILGGAIAAFGIFEFTLFPDRLLFAEKIDHLDGLTAVFLNRNTAATLFGLVVLQSVSFTVRHIQRCGFSALVRTISGQTAGAQRTDVKWAAFYSLIATLATVALMMTKSRAGIAASLLGLAVLLAILSYGTSHSAYARASFERTSRGKRLAKACAAIAAVVIVGVIVANQAVLRANVQGASDLRFCVLPGELRLLGDNWLLGTGLGTFRDVFPPYLDPSCGINYVWNRAHNVFLEGWVNLGLPFVILVIGVIGFLLNGFIKGLRSRRSLRFIPALGLSMVVIVMAHSAVDYSLQIPGFAVFWVAGLAPCMVIACGRSSSTRSAKIAGHSTPVDMHQNRADS
jgi:hypothetical protein